MNKLQKFACIFFPPEVVVSLSLMKKLFKRMFRKQSYSSVNNILVQEAKMHLQKKENHFTLPPSTDRWEFFLSNIRNEILKFHSVKEVIYYAQKEISFDHRQKAAYQFAKLADYESHLKEEFPHFSNSISLISESIYSVKDTLEEVNGRLVSNVLYYHLRYLLQCLTWIKNPQVICEIGGGYGSTARLWIDNPIHCPQTYIIIDFPECLFFAEVYLKTNLGADKVLTIEEFLSKQDSIPPTTPKIILCPIASIGLLTSFSFDLVINTGSMQEMTEDWIDFWMKWLDSSNIRYFYSLNYFAQPLANLEESGNSWSPRLSKHWTMRIKRANPGFVKLHTLRNYAELLAEKVQPACGIEPKYDLNNPQFLDHQEFLDCIDIIRKNPDGKLIYELIKRAENEMKVCPKELYFLIKLLKKQEDLANSDIKIMDLNEIEKKLEAIYAESRKNVVCNSSGEVVFSS